jgi:hypothetical protein
MEHPTPPEETQDTKTTLLWAAGAIAVVAVFAFLAS